MMHDFDYHSDSDWQICKRLFSTIASRLASFFTDVYYQRKEGDKLPGKLYGRVQNNLSRACGFRNHEEANVFGLQNKALRAASEIRSRNALLPMELLDEISLKMHRVWPHLASLPNNEEHIAKYHELHRLLEEFHDGIERDNLR